MIAQRRLDKIDQEESLAMEKLSSGNRIVRSAVDPAGLAISTGMMAKLRSTKMAKENTKNGSSIFQVAEGALSTIQGIGVRLKELAVQSASDTIGDENRLLADFEFQQLKNEIHRISESTQLNGRNLLNDRSSVIDIQVGINHKPGENQLNFDMKRLSSSLRDFHLSGSNVRSKGDSQKSLDGIDKMVFIASAKRADLGGFSQRINYITQNLSTSEINTAASNSRIRDTDVAVASAKKVKAKIMKDASLKLLNIANNNSAHMLKLIS
jgi:flagellin